MSLAIVFKGTEGIVLAADSRVTLPQQIPVGPGQTACIFATYDNATKLLRVKSQTHVGALTYGLGAIGQQKDPRTAHSYIPEFEAELAKKYPVEISPEGNPSQPRLSVDDFAKELSAFFVAKWNEANMTPEVQQDMVFFVAGYDPKSAYGKVFEFAIPSRPEPQEKMAGLFGALWGGQTEIVTRLLNGYDPGIPMAVRQILNVPLPEGAPPAEAEHLEAQLRNRFTARIPWQFLPLQDCVDLSVFVIRATITMQKWSVDIRGVGGSIDVATITQANGFDSVQQKTIKGER